ncbi:MAG: molybdopterin molybdotransferase MoeA [Deltaproteobacteria bacterium]|nr:molybdopterin molybdotransferase MoeA [Deltaproteobacteria bacterium]
MAEIMIGFDEALALILEHVPKGNFREVPLTEATGGILAQDTVSRVDSPSLDVSLMDGYAVRSEDAAGSGSDNEIGLKISGLTTAGGRSGRLLDAGCAIRVTTGAPMPAGADRVLPDESIEKKGERIFCRNGAPAERYILARGADIRAGETIAREGEQLHPSLINLLACGGIDRVPVFVPPKVVVIATGDEVVELGQALQPGQLYASNLAGTAAWLNAFGLSRPVLKILPDNRKKIKAVINELLPEVDAFITSGGAWRSERDLVAGVLEELEWRKVFHGVRLRPGKSAGFGLLEGRPFFILPGGPASHETALLKLALPGLMRMAGRSLPIFPEHEVKLAATVRGKKDWTHVIFGQTEVVDGIMAVKPYIASSRLVSMARKDSFILLPEGVEEITAGREIIIQILTPVSF